jgi:phosphohistidine swiveling domain-containing protein
MRRRRRRSRGASDAPAWVVAEPGRDGAFEQTSATAVIEALRASEAGQAWLAQWESAAQPWFNFSAGSGFYHTDEVWLEHLEIPFGFIRDYIAKLRAGYGGLKGFAASPGVAEGPARVIFSADQIGEVQEGEILVAPLTAPSWAPIFGKIKATVTDVGGMMAHAAIVCREAVTTAGCSASTEPASTSPPRWTRPPSRSE